MLDVYNEREDPRVYGEIDLERRVIYAQETTCLIPWKRCWDSRKNLFLKSCIRVTCGLNGPGDTIITNYYFEPKRWTLRLLRK